MAGFSFKFIPSNGGHTFEVRRYGQVIVGGWCRGDKKEAKKSAARKLASRRPSILR